MLDLDRVELVVDDDALNMRVSGFAARRLLHELSSAGAVRANWALKVAENVSLAFDHVDGSIARHLPAAFEPYTREHAWDPEWRVEEQLTAVAGLIARWVLSQMDAESYYWNEDGSTLVARIQRASCSLLGSYVLAEELVAHRPIDMDNLYTEVRSALIGAPGPAPAGTRKIQRHEQALERGDSAVHVDLHRRVDEPVSVGLCIGDGVDVRLRHPEGAAATGLLYALLRDSLIQSE